MDGCLDSESRLIVAVNVLRMRLVSFAMIVSRIQSIVNTNIKLVILIIVFRNIPVKIIIALFRCTHQVDPAIVIGNFLQKFR